MAERTWGPEQDRILRQIQAEHTAEESASADEKRITAQEKASGLSVQDQIALQNAKAEATERVERAKAERKRLEADLAREKRQEQQDAKREAKRDKQRERAYSHAGSGTVYQSPSGLQNRYIVRGEGGPVWLDAAIVGGSAVASVAWTATRSPGQDIGWGFFLAGLGILTSVEGTGELARFGQGLLGGQAGYLTLRLMGKIQNP